MTLKIQNGDYVTDGCGGLERVEGTQALLQRVLFRLKAHRGQFPFLETLGSRLWQLGQHDILLLTEGKNAGTWQKRWRKSRGCRWSV